MKYLCFILFLPWVAGAQNTVGFQFIQQGVDEGYTLLVPSSYTTTYLIDNCGREVNRWTSSYRPGQAAYLKDNGNMVRSANMGGIYFIGGGRGGILEEYNWNGNLIWTYQHGNSQYCMHHDFAILPNGNILAIAWEKISPALLEQLGRDTATIGTTSWSEKIIEIQPAYPSGGNIVWEWHATDHLVQDFDSTKANFGIIAAHPELLNINYNGSNPGVADWLHFNSIRYNEELDQIMVSSRFFSEIFIIDHSTNSTEAAGHTGGIYGKGGDILYRWGNPAAYNRGTTADQKLFQQHSADWVPAGYLYENAVLVFNNGMGRPGTAYSSADVFFPPVQSNGTYVPDSALPFGPDSAIWTYCDTTASFLYAGIVSSAHFLPSGNMVLSDGPSGIIFEIDVNRNRLWEYISPVTITGPVAQGTTPTGNVMYRPKIS